ncbi:MAG: hypothetical protein NVS4B8_22800 [Herpetosiphon sp.]
MHFFTDVRLLATFATGSKPAGTQLAAVASANTAHFGAAIFRLEQLLPESWLEWPSVGPREALMLGLRAGFAERLLSALGEWSPRDRLLLGLYLQHGIAHDELHRWLKHSRDPERPLLLLRHVAHVVGWSEPEQKDDKCVVEPLRMLERIQECSLRERMHLLVCPACQDEQAALKNAARLVQHVLKLMFVPRQGELLTVRRVVKPKPDSADPLVMLLLALIIVGIVSAFGGSERQGKPTKAALAAMPQSAPDVIARSLKRWETGPPTGILHERYRMLSGVKTLSIERWYDWSAPHHMRQLVKDESQATVLDLVSDGDRRLRFRIRTSPDAERSSLVENAQVAAYVPILRQLPSVGPLGTFPASLINADESLLWLAQQGHSRLLGHTVAGGRAADEIMVDGQPDTLRLAIDRSTGAVLEATRLSDDGRSSTTVWQCDALEQLATVPRDQYEWPSGPLSALPDPRQLGAVMPPSLPVRTILDRKMAIAFPSELPGTTLAAFIHDVPGPSLPVQQIYEGQDWTVMFATSWLHYRSLPGEQLDRTAGTTQFSVLPYGIPDTITGQWKSGNATGTVYYWQAGVSHATREQMLAHILGSMTELGPATEDLFQQRFSNRQPSAAIQSSR